MHPKKLSRISLLQLFVLLCLFSVAGRADDQLLEEAPVDVTKTDKLFVKEVSLEGNTLFSDKELAPIISLYEGRILRVDELQELKDTLTAYYVSHGYINSGVVLEQQTVNDGVLYLHVIEGYLIGLTINGNDRLRDNYIQQRVLPEFDDDTMPVLNVNHLQNRLQLLEQDTRIERLHANLKPGLHPGEAELDLEIEEARAFYMSLTFDNHVSPNVGSLHGQFNAGHLNVFGFGDSIDLLYRRTLGLKYFQVSYAIPLGYQGTMLSTRYSQTNAEVVLAPFDLLDIKSEAKSYGLNLRHPFYKTLNTEVALGVGFEQRRSGSFLLGELFSFIGRGDGGESRVNVLSLSQEGVYRSANQVVAGFSRFDFGVDTLGASNGVEPNGLFNAWLGQVQWIRRFAWRDSQLFWRLLVRVVDDPMLSSEQFPIGGYATVRGYRENQLTRDNGLVTSLEWRVDLLHFSIPGLGEDSHAVRLQLAPFIDYGRGWTAGGKTLAPRDLSSTGIGLLCAVGHHVHAELYWAKALSNVEPGLENDLQDDGVHFQIVFSH